MNTELTKFHNEFMFEIKKSIMRGQYKKTVQRSFLHHSATLMELILTHKDEDLLKFLFNLKSQNPKYCLENHEFNTGFLSGLIAKWLDLSVTDTLDCVVAGLLHDIGETNISSEILLNPKKPTNKEWEIIKQHPKIGLDILNKSPWISQNVLKAVLCHHERLDGTGYPQGLLGSEIPLHARIVAVAGSFDAMTTNRIYEPGVDIFFALTDLRNRSFGQLDAKVTRLLHKKMYLHFIDKFELPVVI